MIRLQAAAASMFIAFSLPVSALADPIQSRGSIDAVTVFRGQALVSRLVEIPGEAGLHELIITDLPEHVVPGSLFAESADGVEVRSVLYRQRPVTQDIREEVRKLDEQIQAVQDKLAAIGQKFALLAERKALIEKLEQFTAPTSALELTKGVLNPNSLKEMAGYLVDQRTAISEEDLKLDLEKRDLDAQLAQLQRERQQLAGASARTAREALLFVNKTNPNGSVRLRYLVDQATWSPSYSVRAGADRTSVSVEYYASIQQLSGEDWGDVAMTLSTAMPSLVSKAPTLEALSLTLTPAQQQQMAQYGQEEFERVQQELRQRKASFNSQRGNRNPAPSQTGAPTEAELDKSINDIACEEQVLEWASAGSVMKRGERKPSEFGDGLSVTYQLSGRTSLPSRSDRQLIQIASMPLQGEFYKVAIPVLTESIYEEAQIANSAGIVLLAGPVSTYLEGEFVGHGEIPTVAAGESFTLGFGIDSSLRIARELYDKVESQQGGNRIVDLTYRLTLENFGSAAANVRVLDRKPKSNGSDVKSTLVSAKPELSEDADYRKTKFKQGILRWDISVLAQANAGNATVIEYQLRLEYDKQMSITGIAMTTPELAVVPQ
jgi:hypothetical protein